MTREEKINAIIRDEWQGWSESDLFEYFRHNRAWDYADQSDSDIDDQYDSICGE